MFFQKLVVFTKKVYLFILALALFWILFSLTISDVSWQALVAALFLLVVCIIAGIRDVKYYPIYLFVAMFGLRVFAVLLVDTEPVSDFQVLYSSAKELLNGYNNMLDSIYYSTWAYQAGYVAYLTFLLWICNSLVFLKIVNCIWGAGICVLVYLIIKELFDKQVARVVSLGYGLFPFPLLFSSVLSNQIPAAFLFYFGVYILLRFYKQRKTPWFYIIPGVIMALGNALRPEGIVFVCAIIGCCILRIQKDKLKRTIFVVFVFCIAYFATFQTCSLLVKYTGLNNYGLVNNEPKWKFVLGLNLETNGQYSQQDVEDYLGKPDLQSEIIKERFAKFNLSNIGEFLKNKESIILSAGDLSWSLQNWDRQALPYGWIRQLNILYYMFFLVCMSVGVCRTLFDIKQDRELLFINILAITMLVYALIEVQPRYAYMLQISVYIVAAEGYELIRQSTGTIKNWRKYSVSGIKK